MRVAALVGAALGSGLGGLLDRSAPPVGQVTILIESAGVTERTALTLRGVYIEIAPPLPADGEVQQPAK